MVANVTAFVFGAKFTLLLCACIFWKEPRFCCGYAGTGVEQDCEEGCELASEVGFLSQDVLAQLTLVILVGKDVLVAT